MPFALFVEARRTCTKARFGLEQSSFIIHRRRGFVRHAQSRPKQHRPLFFVPAGTQQLIIKAAGRPFTAIASFFVMIV